MRMEAVKPKPDITFGNILSMATQIMSLIVILVTVTMAYGRLQARDDVFDLRIAALETQLAKREAGEQSASNRLSTIEGDIRVIRQILEGVRPSR